jgi:hypothetical protein
LSPGIRDEASSPKKIAKLSQPVATGQTIHDIEVEDMTSSELLLYLQNVHGIKSESLPETFGEDVDGRTFLNLNSKTRQDYFIAMGVRGTLAAKLELLVHDIVNGVSTGQDDIKEFANVLDAVRSMAYDENALSDPSGLYKLVYPFPSVRKPYTRFQNMESGTFIFQGRTQLKEIYHSVLELNKPGFARALYMSGELGYGKSYVLCAIVCLLIRSGQRVIYFPDCHEFAADVLQYIRDAYLAAFADDKSIILKILNCQTDDEFIALSGVFASRKVTLWIVADQTTALDYESAGHDTIALKDRVQSLLSRMAYKHILIKSASANYKLARELRVTSETVKKLNHGFSLPPTTNKYDT